MTEPPADVLASAAQIADEVLFAHALEVDAQTRIPPGHFGALAEAGLFGAAGPIEAGGLDLDARTQRRVRETLAGGCLTTAFVWTQHQGVVRRLRSAPAELRDVWLRELCSGRTLGGLVLAGLLPAPEPLLRIQPSHGGFTISGTAPAVSGWGLVGVLLVIARGEPGEVVHALVDAGAPGLHVRPRPLAALNGTQTVEMTFHSVRVDAAAIVHAEPLAPWEAAGDGVRANGAFSLGVAGRCARLAGDRSMHDAVAGRRAALDDAADGDELAQARAGAALLAHRLASRLVVARGSSALDCGEHAQRLAREAVFLLAFGQRPAIRAALLEGLAEPGGAASAAG